MDINKKELKEQEIRTMFIYTVHLIGVLCVPCSGAERHHALTALRASGAHHQVLRGMARHSQELSIHRLGTLHPTA